MKTILAIGLALGLCAPALAASRFGSWSASDSGSYTEAHTSNESGSIFGMLCGQECIFYLNLGRQCQERDTYLAMINSEEGARSIELKCFIVDQDYVLTFPVADEYEAILKRGGTVGFAVPLNSGQFGVSRFSLEGGYQAVEAAVKMAERKIGSDRDGLRDFTI